MQEIIDFVQRFPLTYLVPAVGLGWLVHQLIFSLFRRFVVTDNNTPRAARVGAVRKPSLLLFLSLSISFVLPLIDLDQRVRAGTLHFISIVNITGATWLIISLLRLCAELLLHRYSLDSANNLSARKMHTQIDVLRKIAAVVVFIFGLSAALMTFEQIRQIGMSLLASAGIAGIILGFAAQKSIATLIAGIQIAWTQPIRIDDVVIVKGEWGRIEEINLTYIVVKIWDERRLVVPITHFIEQPFENWTRTSSSIMGTVFLYLDYHIPVAAIREETTRLLQDMSDWDGRVNVVQVTDTTEKSMQVRVLVSAADSGKAWNLRVALREQLIEFLRQRYPECLPRYRVELQEQTPAAEPPLSHRHNEHV